MQEQQSSVDKAYTILREQIKKIDDLGDEWLEKNKGEYPTWGTDNSEKLKKLQTNPKYIDIYNSVRVHLREMGGELKDLRPYIEPKSEADHELSKYPHFWKMVGLKAEDLQFGESSSPFEKLVAEAFVYLFIFWLKQKEPRTYEYDKEFEGDWFTLTEEDKGFLKTDDGKEKVNEVSTQDLQNLRNIIEIKEDGEEVEVVEEEVEEEVEVVEEEVEEEVEVVDEEVEEEVEVVDEEGQEEEEEEEEEEVEEVEVEEVGDQGQKPTFFIQLSAPIGTNRYTLIEKTSGDKNIYLCTALETTHLSQTATSTTKELEEITFTTDEPIQGTKLVFEKGKSVKILTTGTLTDQKQSNTIIDIKNSRISTFKIGTTERMVSSDYKFEVKIMIPKPNSSEIIETTATALKVKVKESGQVTKTKQKKGTKEKKATGKNAGKVKEGAKKTGEDEQAAKQSATKTGQYEKAAQKSAKQAAGYEQTAQTSATQAAGAEGKAQESATQAAGAEGKAKDSAKQAAGYEQTAQTSAKQAAGYEQTAQTSAKQAAGYEQTAQTSAKQAAGYEQTAQTSAKQAAGYEQAAIQSAVVADAKKQAIVNQLTALKKAIELASSGEGKEDTVPALMARMGNCESSLTELESSLREKGIIRLEIAQKAASLKTELDKLTKNFQEMELSLGEEGKVSKKIAENEKQITQKTTSLKNELDELTNKFEGMRIKSSTDRSKNKQEITRQKVEAYLSMLPRPSLSSTLSSVKAEKVSKEEEEEEEENPSTDQDSLFSGSSSPKTKLYGGSLGKGEEGEEEDPLASWW